MSERNIPLLLSDIQTSNFIIHEYFGIDNLIVWDIIKNRLSDLSDDISVLLRSER
ncbi:HepT-like ribonuclease domain-containing protein [Pedobacter superstes]|uniref:HepT-like ribonuclease domain-containing protein n=1 Tax=Pedobacter superstes TaxID=3133441 RepID=UPI003D757646